MTTTTARGQITGKSFGRVFVTFCNQPCCRHAAITATSTIRGFNRSGWIARP